MAHSAFGCYGLHECEQTRLLVEEIQKSHSPLDMATDELAVTDRRYQLWKQGLFARKGMCDRVMPLSRIQDAFDRLTRREVLTLVIRLAEWNAAVGAQLDKRSLPAGPDEMGREVSGKCPRCGGRLFFDAVGDGSLYYGSGSAFVLLSRVLGTLSDRETPTLPVTAWLCNALNFLGGEPVNVYRRFFAY